MAEDDTLSDLDPAAAIAAVTLHPGMLETATPLQQKEWEVALVELQGAEGLMLRAAGIHGEALEMQIRSTPVGFELKIRRPSGLLIKELALKSADIQSTIDEYLEIVEQMRPDSPHFNRTRLEALDVGKRIVHDEAGQKIRKMLRGTVSLDLDTARKLFTLLCVVIYRPSGK